MLSSGISSQAATSKSLSPAAPAHKRFALIGRSTKLDPRVNAVRRDLADVRLAGSVFAPHYAAPMPRPLVAGAALRAAPAADSEIVAQLPAGAIFEVLELAGDHAWGVAPCAGLVGYIDAAALLDMPA